MVCENMYVQFVQINEYRSISLALVSTWYTTVLRREYGTTKEKVILFESCRSAHHQQEMELQWARMRLAHRMITM